jgi:hypothetical protein
MPTPLEQNPNSPGFSLKPLWIIAAIAFAISLAASIGMIIQTMNWLRLKGGGLPAWYGPATTLSEWGLALSSASLIALAVVTILRNYRK